MPDAELATLFRGTERVLIDVGAILALYFGYRLFVLGCTGAQSGEFSAASYSVKLVRVGPGIFFALFGSAILITSVGANLTYYDDRPAAGLDTNRHRTNFSYAGGNAGDDATFRTINDLQTITDKLESDEDISRVHLDSLRNIQHRLVRGYLGDEIVESCQEDADQYDEHDCSLYRELTNE